MTLSLTASDQQRLAAATEALTSPLAYPTLDAWRRAASVHVRALLKAEKVIFLLPIEGQIDLFTEDFDPSIKQYPAEIGLVASHFAIFQRLRMLGAADRPSLFGKHLDAYYRTAYWNEYARPHRAYDGLTLSVPVIPGQSLASHAQLIFNHDTPQARPFGPRGVALSRLLLPALQAGALAWLRLAHARHALITHVDALHVAALLFSADGREIHRNDAARRLIASLGEQARDVGPEAQRLARAQSWWPGTEAAPASPTARVGRLTLRATHLGPDDALQGRTTLVMIEHARTTPAEALSSEASLQAALATLQAAFGLTRQQAHVALLLSARRSTAEVAGALSISGHTVRRHVEQVLERVGVKRRADLEMPVSRALRTMHFPHVRRASTI